MDKITHQVRAEHWTKILNECMNSGMSKTAWCRANGISEKQFFYWQHILRREAQKTRTWRLRLAPHKRRSTGDYPGAIPCTDAGTGDRIQTPNPGSAAQRELLRNSILTPSLGASIMNAKYVNGLPLYRISQEFLRNDIHISRQVMANWMIQCADRYLGPLYDYLHNRMYHFHVLQADETPVKVSKDGRPANSKSYMWVYRTGKGYSDTPIILYEYQKTRKADHLREFLKGITGTVVCDGYSACRKLDWESETIVFAGCWTHARRYFADALKALPKQDHQAAKDTVAYEATKRIGAIYHLDTQLADLKPDDWKKQRQINLKPLVEAFFVWAKEIQTSGRLTKGKTLEGINYCINQEEALKVFLDDGEVPLDNNATEGSLRSLCLHKHAWKLIDSIDGAQSSAIIYSITETAKANNLNPFRYLEYILTVMKEHQEDTDYRFMEELLPWSEQLPEICKSKTKTTNV